MFSNVSLLLLLMDGFETWSLSLREDHKLLAFDNKVLWKKCGSMGGEV
jgi:hypothetical protein